MARDEIQKLRSEPANYPDTIARQKKEIELLEIFAEGFERIAQTISAYVANPNERKLLTKVENLVASVGKQLDAWWMENASEAIDWGVRLPIIVGGVAALGWAGADMTVGTSVVAALVGGTKVMDVIARHKKPK
jgi:hypothetical protein